MNWLFAKERAHYRQHGPFEAYVHQSRFQQDRLLPVLGQYGVRPNRCHRIRGAFSYRDWSFRPLAHRPGEPLVIGRASRASTDKFPRDLWAQYARIPGPKHVRVLGWDRKVQRKCGPPPDWAEVLAPGAESPERFFSTLHLYMQVNGGATENWPRVGLEAMAAGVPVIAEARWGWPEMVTHLLTGYLADSPVERAAHAADLAHCEPLRVELACNARARLERDLADPETLWRQWSSLFACLTAEP
jgi:hypothetical protein